MFRKQVVSLLTLGLMAFGAQAATAVFDWAAPSFDVPLAPNASPNCNGGATPGTTDYCGTSLKYLNNGIGLTVTASAKTAAGVPVTSAVRVIQDAVGDFGGLGVLTAGETGNLDQVGGGGFLERLILTFDQFVAVSVINFYDDHAANPSFAGHEFFMSVDGVTKLSNKTPAKTYNLTPLLVGKVFEFWNPYATPDKSWYLSGMTVETSKPPNEVPEPSTYVLMLAGLGMLGFMMKRRIS